MTKCEVNLVSQDNENYIYLNKILIKDNSWIHIFFKVFVDSSIKFDHRWILTIHTFDNQYKYSQNDATQYTNYYLDNYKSDKLIKIDIDFVPLDGNYMKIFHIFLKMYILLIKMFKLLLINVINYSYKT